VLRLRCNCSAAFPRRILIFDQFGLRLLRNSPFYNRDGKEPSLLGFSLVRVLPKVRFGSVRVICKHGKFGFGSGSVLVVSVLSLVRFCMGLEFGRLTVLTLPH